MKRNLATLLGIQVAAILCVFAIASNSVSAQSADTLHANDKRIAKFALNIGHTDDESFIVNNGKSTAGQRSTKDIREVQCGTNKCFLVVMVSKTTNGNIVDSVWADRRTFALVRHVEHGSGNHTEVNVTDGRIRGSAVDSGKAVRTIDEAAPAYDFSVVEEIIANLPLKEKYQTTIHTYDITRGFRDVGVTVIASELLDTTAGPRPTWVVDLTFSSHKATRWFDQKTGEGLKWNVEMGGGRSMWGRAPVK